MSARNSQGVRTIVGCLDLVPQEFGLRTDCRWFELIESATGRVFRIDAVDAPFHASAVHHLPSDLFRAVSDDELIRRDEVVVCLDTAHRGLGTASCGPDVAPAYRLAAGPYTLAYRLSLRPPPLPSSPPPPANTLSGSDGFG